MSYFLESSKIHFLAVINILTLFSKSQGFLYRNLSTSKWFICKNLVDIYEKDVTINIYFVSLYIFLRNMFFWEIKYTWRYLSNIWRNILILFKAMWIYDFEMEKIKTKIIEYLYNKFVGFEK